MVSRETPRERATLASHASFPRIVRGVTFNPHGSPVTTARLRYDVSPDGERVRPALRRATPVAALLGFGTGWRRDRDCRRAQLIEQLAVREHRRTRRTRYHQRAGLRGTIAD